MKRLLLAFFLILSAQTILAQQYRPFQLYIGMGYAGSSGNTGSLHGMLFDLEPTVRLNDGVAIGLRLGFAAMVADQDAINTEGKGPASASLNIKYYLSNGRFRPYIGLGYGIFRMLSVTRDQIGGSVAHTAGKRYGFYPRVGFDYGHFNFNVDYNLVPKSNIEVSFWDGSVVETDIRESNNYIGIRVGGFFFGGLSSGPVRYRQGRKRRHYPINLQGGKKKSKRKSGRKAAKPHNWGF